MAVKGATSITRIKYSNRSVGNSSIFATCCRPALLTNTSTVPLFIHAVFENAHYCLVIVDDQGYIIYSFW